MKIFKRMEKNICYLYLSEIWDYNDSSVLACMDLMKFYFRNCPTLFFDFYRKYGGDRVDDDIDKFQIEIVDFFRKYGDLETEHYIKNKWCSDMTMNAIGRLPVNKETFEMIPYFCDFYLETLMFTPSNNYTWEQFVEYFQYHTMDRKIEYLLDNKFANIIFTKTDGGDFNIIFNKDILDLAEVEGHITNIIKKI